MQKSLSLVIPLKLIVFIGRHKEQQFFRELAKIEYSVGIFCSKLAAIAANEGKLHLSKDLSIHSTQETKHGKMLASLCDGKDKIVPDKNTNGKLLTKQLGDINLIKPTYAIHSNDVKSMSWKRLTGEHVTATFENFDGLSDRYISLRFLFAGKKAAEFSWDDRFAFMHALERVTELFYQLLSESKCSPALKAIAAQIANDEQQHSDYLLKLSSSESIEYWNNRIQLAIWVTILDLCKICFRIKRNSVNIK